MSSCADGRSLQRYRRTGPSKRFRLGITAPLHPHFVDACKTLEIPVPEEYLQGGVYVDGERAEGGVVEGVDGQWIEDLGMRLVYTDASCILTKLKFKASMSHLVRGRKAYSEDALQ